MPPQRHPPSPATNGHSTDAASDFDRSVGVIISDAQGQIVDQNALARRLLGRCVGRTCFAGMTGARDAETLPCTTDCAARLRVEGHDAVRFRSVRLGGGNYDLCCVPVGDRIVTTLVAAAERPEPWERFTPRELDVLRELAAGRTSAEIARALDISASTVRAHVEHMRVKLDAPSRAALVARGFLMGYLP